MEAKVKLGERRGAEVEIVEGVMANTQVVTAGQLKLRNGAPVEVIDPGPAPAAKKVGTSGPAPAARKEGTSEPAPAARKEGTSEPAPAARKDGT
jgi:membrane fusion protein (multidrug efflux system)